MVPDSIEAEQDKDKNVEEIFEKYYSKFSEENKDNEQNETNVKSHSVVTPLSMSKEEYLQETENNNDLQNMQTNDVKNSGSDAELSNKLFLEVEKNKIIYSCYRCRYETDSQNEYDRHCVINHPNKAASPSLADIEKDGLKPQGKPWE